MTSKLSTILRCGIQLLCLPFDLLGCICTCSHERCGLHQRKGCESMSDIMTCCVKNGHISQCSTKEGIICPCAIYPRFYLVRKCTAPPQKEFKKSYSDIPLKLPTIDEEMNEDEEEEENRLLDELLTLEERNVMLSSS